MRGGAQHATDGHIAGHDGPRALAQAIPVARCADDAGIGVLRRVAAALSAPFHLRARMLARLAQILAATPRPLPSAAIQPGRPVPDDPGKVLRSERNVHTRAFDTTAATVST